MVTAAPEMLKVARTIERVANTDVSVMLLGASGTGKELLARGLHQAEPAPRRRLRRDQLRGDPREPARGGAVRLREGRLHRRDQDHRGQDRARPWRHPVPRRGRRHPAAAPGQAAALPAGAGDRADRRPQADRGRHPHRLRHPPESRGDDRRRHASARTSITASPRSSCGSRPSPSGHGDAVLLAKHFLDRFAREMNPQVKGFAPGALAAIEQWPWPGNVRELENRMKRAVIMADGKLITAEDLDLQARRAMTSSCRSTSRRRASGRPRGDPPGAGADRQQYLERRQAARDQPADALRPAEAIRPAAVMRAPRLVRRRSRSPPARTPRARPTSAAVARVRARRRRAPRGSSS